MSTEDLQDEAFIEDEQLQEDLISESDEPLDPRQVEFLKQYRVVSRIALCALATSIIGLLSVLDFSTFWLIAAVALIISWLAIYQVNTSDGSVIGKLPARVALVFSLVGLIGGYAWEEYSFYLRVPDNHIPLKWSHLEPEDFGSRGGIPKRAGIADGKDVYIEGYVHPGVSGMGNIAQFVLVGDFDTCCYGGQPKAWDMIEVQLPENVTIQYSRERREIWGKLLVNQSRRIAVGTTGTVMGDEQLQGGYYQLVAVGIR